MTTPATPAASAASAAPKVNASLDGRLYLSSANGMQYCQQHDLFFAGYCWNCASPAAKDKQAQSNKLAAANLAAQQAAAASGTTPGGATAPAVVAAPAEELGAPNPTATNPGPTPATPAAPTT